MVSLVPDAITALIIFPSVDCSARVVPFRPTTSQRSPPHTYKKALLSPSCYTIWFVRLRSRNKLKKLLLWNNLQSKMRPNTVPARPAASQSSPFRHHRSFPYEYKSWITKVSGVSSSRLAHQALWGVRIIWKGKPWMPPKTLLSYKEYSKLNKKCVLDDRILIRLSFLTFLNEDLRTKMKVCSKFHFYPLCVFGGASVKLIKIKK